jgi:hypothetical protein
MNKPTEKNINPKQKETKPMTPEEIEAREDAEYVSLTEEQRVLYCDANEEGKDHEECMFYALNTPIDFEVVDSDELTKLAEEALVAEGLVKLAKSVVAKEPVARKVAVPKTAKLLPSEHEQGARVVVDMTDPNTINEDIAELNESEDVKKVAEKVSRVRKTLPNTSGNAPKQVAKVSTARRKPTR